MHRPGWLKTYAFYSAEQDEWLIGAIRRGDPADGHLIGYEREKARAEASMRIGVPMLADASAVSLCVDSYKMTIGGISVPNHVD